MSKNVELEVAQATLSELVAAMTPDDDIVIMKDRKPVAKPVATSVVRPPRVPGLMKGKLTVHHKDPHDRMLIARAIVEEIAIVSSDNAFVAYPVTRLW